MTLRPCLRCGVPSVAAYCTDHGDGGRTRRSSPRTRGYDIAWDRLSVRARKAQPFCSDCGSVEHLTTDHKPSAWRRKALGLAVRLVDVDVLCNDCNARRGSSRPGSSRSDRPGEEAPNRTTRTAGEPRSPLHTADLPPDAA